MNTATEVRKLTNMQGDASLYKLSEPLDGNEYVVVSALNLEVSLGMILPEWQKAETYIFPADESGEVVDWGELAGSQKGTLDHAVALRDAGYEVA